MYSGSSLGVCDAHYEEVRPDGTRAPIDRSELIHEGRSAWRMRPKERRIRQEQVEAIGQQLCRALPGSEVHARARCSTRKDWEDTHDGRRNLCQRRSQ